MGLIFFTYRLALSQLLSSGLLLLSFPVHGLVPGPPDWCLNAWGFVSITAWPSLGQAPISEDLVSTSAPAGDGRSFHSWHTVRLESSLFCGCSEQQEAPSSGFTAELKCTISVSIAASRLDSDPGWDIPSVSDKLSWHLKSQCTLPNLSRGKVQWNTSRHAEETHGWLVLLIESWLSSSKVVVQMQMALLLQLPGTPVHYAAYFSLQCWNGISKYRLKGSSGARF